jgi:hypothetical protein
VDVIELQLEIDPNDPLPIREIGINIKDKIIMIMPWRSNYGYWTGDNNVELNQFKKEFNAIEISKEEFEKNWNLFSKNNSTS